MKGFTVQIKRRFINKNLRDAIEKAGFTNDSLSKKVGLHGTKISMISNFRYNPSEDLKVRLAVALNVPIDDIFPEKYDELYEKISPISKEANIKIDFVSLSSPEFLMLESENGRYEMEQNANANWRKEYIEKELKKITQLKEKYMIILKLRSEGMTYDEVGKEYGVTRERVRQIEAKCHEIIRQEAPHLAKLIS